MKNKAQSSFELLVTLSFGLVLLLPVVAIAFIQLASINASLSAIQAQQSSNKLASVATLVGAEGPPSKQLVEIYVPTGVEAIYVGSATYSLGHEIIFVIRSPNGLSYVTSYTPVNVSGFLGGASSVGTYLINVSAESSCPNAPAYPCVYITEVT
ncbi:MAG: hypothetical protein QXL16_01080 [Candidatus Micrarchaeaceae archaeon]